MESRPSFLEEEVEEVELPVLTDTTLAPEGPEDDNEVTYVSHSGSATKVIDPSLGPGLCDTTSLG